MSETPDKPEDQASPEAQPDEEERRPLRKVPEDELKQILEAHETWVQSEGREGKQADLQGADLREANLQGADLSSANLQGADLSSANLQKADLRRANLQGADLHKADLQGASLIDANLQEADLFRANLQGADLMQTNLRGANLREANLQGVNLLMADLPGANLWMANLQGAYLVAADLNGAHLSSAKFEGDEYSNLGAADLTGADLRNADLANARLSDVTGLLPANLTGANLSNTKLPEDIAKFEGLAYVEETSKNARKIFFAMLLGCVYSWLTIATTTDARLLTNSASSPLPIIQTETPIVGFYLAAPVILLSLYIYFHLYLQRLWEGLAKLPAVFPDGKPLHQKAYPWLLNGLVRAHFRLLQKDRTLLSRLENMVSTVLAWWVVPATVLLFWGRYLPRHDWVGTGIHLALLTVLVGGAIMLHRHAVRTLRGTPTKFRLTKPWLDARTYQGTTAIGIGVIIAAISLGAIEGNPRYKSVGEHPDPFVFAGDRTWVPYAFERLGYRTFANLREAEVSTKPENWRGDEKDIPLVKGASLRGSDLRYADAEKAFLVKADLRGANLQGANLLGADLQGANLQLANLGFVNLQGANLQEADLRRANLQAADLTGANLKGADLFEANLKGADLFRANLKGANLPRANLQEASLFRANLQGADLRHANLQGTQLFRANLQGADLQGAKLQGAYFLHEACGDAKTKLPPNLSVKPCPKESK